MESGSFSQHGKYFFKDGNVQFLVCRVTRYIAYAPNVLTIPRLMATSTVSIVTSSLAILCISPLDLPSLGSVITRLHPPLYPWEMSKAGTSKPFSLFCILSEFSIPYLLFCLSKYIRLLEILKSTTYRMNNGDRFSVCPLAGASIHFGSWH